MKTNMLSIFLVLFVISCSKDDNVVTNNEQEQLIAFIDKIKNISQNGSSELRFIYNEDNNLIKTETDTYVRDFVYSDNKIVQIISTTLPDALYYTIDFIYNGEQLVEVQRNNHHNNTVFYVTYDYDPSNRVTRVCTYNNVNDYNLGECNRFYSMAYQGITNNFFQKDLVLYTIGGVETIEVSQWTYDSNKRPYFGEAIEKIRLPYATDGTGMDYEHIYNTNNPVSKTVFDTNTNENRIRKNYAYEYDNDDLPSKMIVTTYDINTGAELSIFTQEYSYILK